MILNGVYRNFIKVDGAKNEWELEINSAGTMTLLLSFVVTL